MILNRVEKDNSVKAIYESSNILASSYNKLNNDLNITFKNGGNYTYQNVSATDYMRFETAESQGKILNGNIKKYSVVPHGKVDTEALLKQLKESVQLEVNAMENGIVTMMIETIDIYHNDNKLPTRQLEKLTEMMTLHKGMV